MAIPGGLSAGQVLGGTYGILRATGALDKVLESLGISGDVWTLRVADQDRDRASIDKDAVLVSQAAPEGLIVGMQGRSSSVSVVGDYVPTLIPTGAEADSWSFSATFAADHAFDDLRPIRDLLVAMHRKDATLGRRPVVVLSYGGDSVTGYLQGLTWRPVRGSWPLSGNPRAYQFSIRLERTAGRALESTSPEEPERETTYVTLGSGETPELVAWREYGDPMLGVRIRQLNPQFRPEPVGGDRLKVLDRTHPDMRGAVRPRSAAFGTPEGLARLEALAELRLEETGIPPGVEDTYG